MRFSYNTLPSQSLNYLSSLEVFCLIYNILNFIIVLYVVAKTPFHYNLRTIIISMFFYFYFFALGRLVINCHRLYDIDYFIPEKSVLMIIAECLTIFFIHFVMISMLGLYFERQLSTYYIADYEKITRKHLPWIIILFITTLSILCTTCFFFEIIEWYYSISFSYLCMCVGVLLFIKLYHTNMEKWTEVQNDHRRARHAYTLSLRFQLEENIRSMKLIKHGFSVLGFAGIADFVLFGLSNMEYLRHLDDGYLTQLLSSLCYLFMSIIAMAVPIAALCSHPTYMKILQKTRFIGKLVAWYDVPSIHVSKTNDTSQYFANLSKQWNTFG